MHQVCQYKYFVSCNILWAYPGFCQNNEMEIAIPLLIWKGAFHYNLQSISFSSVT